VSADHFFNLRSGAVNDMWRDPTIFVSADHFFNLRSGAWAEGAFKGIFGVSRSLL